MDCGENAIPWNHRSTRGATVSARRARAEVDEEAMAEPRTMEEVMEARREARRVAAGIRRVPPPAASKEPEGDCVITGSRSAEARDVELMRDAITIEDSEEEEEGAQPTGAGTLEDHLKELRGFLDDDGFDVSVALKWCEANGADKLYEIVEADMVDEFVASFALKPVKAGVLAKKLREFRRGN